MSFRSKERVRIPARRSSSTSRAPSSSSTQLGATRPHTLGLYGYESSSPGSSFHQRNTYSLPQSPSYKSSYSPSSYGQSASPYTSTFSSHASPYGYGSGGLHGSLNSLNTIGNSIKRNSYGSKSKHHHGGYGDRKNNGYSSFTLAFESPKHYQPNTSRANAGTTPAPTPPERSRARGRAGRPSRSDENPGGGVLNSNKRSISLNSLASEGYAVS